MANNLHDLGENLNGHDISHHHSDCTDLPEPHFNAEPDKDTTTVQGCECDSVCGSTIDFGNFNCDWCYTKKKANGDDCGHYSYSRFKYYDYCIYPRQDAYDDYQTTIDNLWSKISANTTHSEYPSITGIFQESIQTSFDDHWDYMPVGRKKMIHGIGAVCKIDMDITSSRYTGILQKGKAKGIIRMGSGTEIDPKKKQVWLLGTE
eukprot:UN31613